MNLRACLLIVFLAVQLNAAAAGKVLVGKELGNRFYDLAYKSPTGKAIKLSDLRGKVVVVHFWASWCPPCRHEMPHMQTLHQALGPASPVQWVLLQVREDFATARRWALQQPLNLPLHDSGVKDRASDFLTLANGTTLPDRTLAPVFPSTYILDKQGVVVYSHTGPIEDWSPQLPFLQRLAGK